MKKKLFIGIYGHPGAGKSQLSMTLQRRLKNDYKLDAEYIEVDKVVEDFYKSYIIRQTNLLKEKFLNNSPIFSNITSEESDSKPWLVKKYKFLSFLYRQKWIEGQIIHKANKSKNPIIIVDFCDLFHLGKIWENCKADNTLIHVNTPKDICIEQFIQRENQTKEYGELIKQRHSITDYNKFDHLSHTISKYTIKTFNGIRKKQENPFFEQEIAQLLVNINKKYQQIEKKNEKTSTYKNKIL